MQSNLFLDRTLAAANVDGIVHLMLELEAPAAVASNADDEIGIEGNSAIGGHEACG